MMPLGKNMPKNTRVKHAATGAVGSTQEWLPNVPPVGAYKVKWDDGIEEQVRAYQLDPEGGMVTEDAYKTALQLVVARLGGYEANYEGQWLHQGKLVDSVLIVSAPSHLDQGEEMHAHANMGGGVLKAHVKKGNSYVRSVFANGGFASAATAEDKKWLANIRLYNSLKSSKQLYMDGKKELPK
jgi:hypothetical protein